MALTAEQAARLTELEAMDPKAPGMFKNNQERIKLAKLRDAGGGGASEAPADVETTGEEAPAAAPAPSAEASAATAKLRENKAKPAKATDAAPSDEAGIYLGATRVPLDKSSPLHKSIVKICKAYEALEAAKAGE